jgi:EAL domain-containing protein (putative c-di-GMP-specific phosphodiesterase class I)
VDNRQLSIGVNLFPVQLDGNACRRSRLRARAQRAESTHLELELTETIALRDDGIAASALANLRARGIRVAYDDFGTGYASLSVLRRLPVDRSRSTARSCATCSPTAVTQPSCARSC